MLSLTNLHDRSKQVHDVGQYILASLVTLDICDGILRKEINRKSNEIEHSIFYLNMNWKTWDKLLSVPTPLGSPFIHILINTYSSQELLQSVSSCLFNQDQ
jgi:hypothetical protein